MSILRFIPELPLLRRELIELANRRRTYVVRFLGAIVVLSIVLWQFFEQINGIAGAIRVGGPAGGWIPNKFYGAGGRVFFAIVPMLFQSVQLLMPALICGAITIEKERNTLGTLFVTRLSPMTIVLEKLGSRIVPMLTFLLLTFPLLAFVYSLGGVDTALLLSTLWLLLCECLFYASVGLLCSSWFATTASAFIAAYILSGLLIISSTIMQVGMFLPVLTPYDVWKFAFGRLDFYSSGSSRGWIAEVLADILNDGSGTGRSVVQTLIAVSAASVPSLLASAIFLLLARLFLIRRAFISSSSVMLRTFKWIDGFFTRLNDRTTGGVVLIRDYESLPLFDPVAWRERAKKSLGKARYLFRVLIVLEGPVLFICLGAATVSHTTDFSGLRVLLYLMWGITTMILAMKASTMISSERTRETLDALFSTPLTSKEIIQQKIAGMRRLMIVLSIPILSIHFTLLLMQFDVRNLILNPSVPSTLTFSLYSVMTVATTCTVMHLIAWLSALMGLRSTTQARSVMAAISTISIWLVVSVFLFSPGGFLYGIILQGMSPHSDLAQFRPGYSSMAYRETFERNLAIVSTMACMVRPDGSIQANESILIAASGASISQMEAFHGFSRSRFDAFLASLLVLLVQVLILFIVRVLTLTLAPRLLGRRDGGAGYRIPGEQLCPAPTFQPEPAT